MLMSRLSMTGLTAAVLIGFSPSESMAAGPNVNLPGNLKSGNCTQENTRTRQSKGQEVRTIVEDHTSSIPFDVTIYRNDKKNNEKIITPSDPQIRNTMSGSQGSGEIKVRVDIFRRDTPDFTTLTCEYLVTYNGTNMHATWSLPDGANSICPDGIETICKDCEMACKNNWISGSKRWTTTLTISD